jgi:L-Ala-D/L-Glu epimerase
MRVAGFTAYIIDVPLRRPFRHASVSRQASENIVVECRLEDGTVGWGEGVPRSYVTGDTPESSLRLIANLKVQELFSQACRDWNEVVAMLDRFLSFTAPDDPRGCTGNPLRAAMEISVLDAFGQAFGQPICKVASAIAEAQPILMEPQRVRYSTTIDAEHASRLWKSALKMRLYGFAQCKVKIGSAAQDDAVRLATIRRWIGPRIDLRVDANEAWSVNDCRDRMEPLRVHNISCIEQPVPHAQLSRLAELQPRLEVPVMLDESLTGWKDAEESIRLGVGELWNLRLSKCGGFIACSRLAALAQRHGIGYQLGCHPGETGILSAAGRQWAQSIRAIRYCEGSYDRHVLAANLIEEEITFGYGGHAQPLTDPGLGITVSRTKLRSMTIAQQEHPVLE